MKEYTILALLAVFMTLLLDSLLRTHLVRQRLFWIFWAIMAMLTTVINGYLTWRPMVQYGEWALLGIRIGTIPLEDYLFGFSLLTMNLIVWETTGRRFSTAAQNERTR